MIIIIISLIVIIFVQAIYHRCQANDIRRFTEDQILATSQDYQSAKTAITNKVYKEQQFLLDQLAYWKTNWKSVVRDIIYVNGFTVLDEVENGEQIVQFFERGWLDDSSMDRPNNSDNE